MKRVKVLGMALIIALFTMFVFTGCDDGGDSGNNNGENNNEGGFISVDVKNDIFGIWNGEGGEYFKVNCKWIIGDGVYELRDIDTDKKIARGSIVFKSGKNLKDLSYTKETTEIHSDYSKVLFDGYNDSYDVKFKEGKSINFEWSIGKEGWYSKDKFKDELKILFKDKEYFDNIDKFDIWYENNSYILNLFGIFREENNNYLFNTNDKTRLCMVKLKDGTATEIYSLVRMNE